MKSLAITSEGIEGITALEIKELINAKTEIKKGCVVFEPKKLEELSLLCYKAQSVDKILYLFGCFNFNDSQFFDQLKDSIGKIDFSKWLDKKKTFKVSCKKVSSELSSEELCSKAGEFVIDKIAKANGYQQKADMNNPDIVFFIYLDNNTCYLGIDFAGFELHKRSYRIFVHQSSLRATIAYALVRIAGFKEKETLLDPFSGSGTIPIEAAHFITGFPINYYNKDKFAFQKFMEFNFNNIDKKIKKTSSKIYGYDSNLSCITNSKKNAKIAGIEKSINFSRIDIEWLDTKFDKETVNKIVTHPPQLSRNIEQKTIEKIYNEFFYQAEFVLKKQGKIVIISRSSELLKKYAEKYKFKVEAERDVYSGKEKLVVLVFVK